MPCFVTTQITPFPRFTYSTFVPVRAFGTHKDLIRFSPCFRHLIDEDIAARRLAQSPPLSLWLPRLRWDSAVPRFSTSTSLANEYPHQAIAYAYPVFRFQSCEIPKPVTYPT